MTATTAFNAPTPVAPRARQASLSQASTALRRSTFTTPITRHATILPQAQRAANSPAAGRRAVPTMAVLQNVVVAGGTGFVGARLTRALTKAGKSVTVLTRNPAGARLPQGATAVAWTAAPAEGDAEWKRAMRGADLVVNLTGEPVVSRWEGAGRERIVRSRLDSSAAIAQAIEELPDSERPGCFVGASGVGYYGFEMGDRVVDEGDAVGKGFLAELCVDWEREGEAKMKELGVRSASTRLGVVLGAGGGALGRMVPAFQFFVGGTLGSGQQWVSWVHVDDVVRAIQQIGENESMSGVYNLTAPNPVRMGEMCSSLAGALNRPSLFPVPAPVVKLGLGEASSVLLEGQNAAPKRLLDAGFNFKYSEVDEAMKAVVNEL